MSKIHIELISRIIPKLSFKFPYEAEDYAENLYFENYHYHKDFSNTNVADSAESIQDYAYRTTELKGKCLFSGDHGSQGNQFEVYNTAEKSRLKYRHSTEAYWVKNRLEKDRTNSHMVLVAKNAEGRKDINFALSMANIDGYYYRPRIDLELLLNIPKDNVIVTSACIAGWLYEDAEDIWLKIAKHFGNNFFLEVQTNNTPKQVELNKKILKIARENDIQIICGLDSHYTTDKSSVKRDQILKYKKTQYPEENGWYMDYPDSKEIIERFKNQGVLNDEEILISIMNTNIFVSECEDIVFDRHFKIPNVYPNVSYDDRTKIYKNLLNKSYTNEKLKTKEKADGVRYESKEVIDSGVVDYFLFNEKLIKDAVENEGGILTTTSRGSSASFITNKLLGFTTIDRFNSEIPIYPERFLTKERVLAGQMPDIDFNVAEQEPFVRSAKKLVGEHGCYPLMAIEKLKEKAAWQLYAGANEVPPQTANQISKFIEQYNEKVKYADDEDKDLIDIEDFIPDEYMDTYKKSLEYQGITIKLKVHACGYLVLDGDIRREIGLINAVSETTGERTLCACIEGGYLDDFGYVKDDFLIVDSVHLTYKFFKGIGMNVPTFDELREMIKGDPLTWEIYEKGITCCINQVEKESTTNKMKKYKARSLAELSAFIAGIRPGFKSLLPTFLDRREYTTGEGNVDLLLDDSYHFMIYQESIMKVLSFLDVAMGDTYNIIKSISKKKLAGEKKEKLKQQLRDSWMSKFNNLDNFDNVWHVIEDSARYAFNSPHALSMGGDSAYQAWGKAHHTSQFYEIAIDHYQSKNKKDKIDALVKEIIKFYGYKLGDYEFGKDNRRVTLDTVEKIIYPNISSIKGFGEKVADDLYELGKSTYESFADVIVALQSKSINKTNIKKLIRIDYFKKFGEINTLLEIVNLLDLFLDAKEIFKERLVVNGINIDIISKYGNETAKKYTKLQIDKLLPELIRNINCKPATLLDRVDSQRDVLGIITLYDETVDKRLYYVSELEVKQSIVNISLYELYSGKTRDVKMWTNQYNRYPIDLEDLVFVSTIEKKFKKEFTGEINEITGKKIYQDVPDKFEYWLSKYHVKERKELDEVLLYR